MSGNAPPVTRQRVPAFVVRSIAGASAGVALMAMTGAFKPRPFTGDDVGLRVFVTPEITVGQSVGERFTMNASGMRAVEVQPVAVGAVTGRVRIELRAAPGGPALVSRDVAAADLAAGSRYRVTVPAQADSRGRRYDLEFSSSDEAPARGVALVATMGERLAGGSLLVNGVERWADLAFRADAAVSLPAPLPLPDLRRGRNLVAVLLLAIGWLALVLAIRGGAQGAAQVPGAPS